MKTRSVIVSLAVLCLSAPVLADDDCDDPVTDWQPREHLRQKLEAEGWTIYRIKVDDGCYEVKGLAPEGFGAEASFAPATLELMELEREDDDEDEEDDEDEDNGEYGYRDNRGDGQARDKAQTNRPVPHNGIVKGRPTVTVE
ncbi:PepSY domain-containing protein [Marinobacter sp.]|uniref:PepSY domain-containing protein n=1 Tax=Marinobacter sp. TaxID=50741 RepID=UPI0019BEC535|nr:PepSY domain-containing protein [Marinobacter sp.]MBC7193451.1 PepSY domain-containing protein [Marinobacter sp.]